MPIALLLAGGGLGIVLVWLLWDSAVLQRDLAQAQRDRDRVRIEKLLQRAVASPTVFAALPAERCVRCDAAGEPALDGIGWLAIAASALDDDIVVADRLQRAGVAEFGARDAAATERAYAELLAAPLVAAVRLTVVAAAAWQARRAGANAREATLRAELDERLAALAPHDLARPALAEVVVSAVRLAGASEPAWAATLVPFLPPERFAALPMPNPWSAAHAAVVARRQVATTVASVLRSGREVAIGCVPVDARTFVWWQTLADGARQAAWLDANAFVQAIAQVAARDPEFEPGVLMAPLLAASTQMAFGGVPGLDDAALRARVPLEWRTPALTGALVVLLACALGSAVLARLRAMRAETLAVRSQAEFLTTVTHELKTPLAAIRLLGDLLAEGRARGRENDYYRMLAGESARLSMLIENVLDLGRLERGQRAYEVQPVVLGDVLGETLTLFAPVLERDGGSLQWCEPREDATVRLDRAAFVQALVVVLDNARKYGGQPPRVFVQTQRDGAWLRVHVRDHGPGVPASERERVFARFVRGASHAHGSTPGVGIGLYLARTLVTAMGGELACGEPLDGGPGACFTFSLPMVEPA